MISLLAPRFCNISLTCLEILTQLAAVIYLLNQPKFSQFQLSSRGGGAPNQCWGAPPIDASTWGGTGVQHLLSILGIAASEAMACGDAVNDVEMLKLAGTGVAMGTLDVEGVWMGGAL